MRITRWTSTKRKEKDKLNLSAKEKRMHIKSQEYAKQVDYRAAIKNGSEVRTWSATHIAYYAPRPAKSGKLCLCCQKQWPADTDQIYCDCEANGRLYHTK